MTLALGIAASLNFAAPTKGRPSSQPKGLPVYSKPKGYYNRPYKSFAPYELPLGLPQSVKPNRPYSSTAFYAVVVRVAPAGFEPDCDAGEFSSDWERERKSVQKLFPERKVFAAHQCPDMAAVTYSMDGKPSTRPFIAIYGGGTRREAEQVRTKIKKTYRTASIKRMSVSFEQIMQ